MEAVPPEKQRAPPALVQRLRREPRMQMRKVAVGAGAGLLGSRNGESPVSAESSHAGRRASP